jgi:hypothetical protein
MLRKKVVQIIIGPCFAADAASPANPEAVVLILSLMCIIRAPKNTSKQLSPKIVIFAENRNFAFARSRNRGFCQNKAQSGDSTSLFYFQKLPISRTFYIIVFPGISHENPCFTARTKFKP